MGGFGSTLDNRTGIQSSQQMFDETYQEALANEALANVIETQGVPDVVPFSVQGALSPVNVADGVNQFETDYVKGLLDQGLVTVEEVAAQTGIPAAEIQATYDALSAQDIADTLSTSEDTAAGLIGLTVGDNEMFVADEETTAAAQAASQAAADAAAADDSLPLDSTVAADPDLTGSTEQTAAELEAEAAAAAEAEAAAAAAAATESSGGYAAGDVVTDDRIVGDYPFVYDADANVFHYTPFDVNGNRI